jgi:hypothetical protein
MSLEIKNWNQASASPQGDHFDFFFHPWQHNFLVSVRLKGEIACDVFGWIVVEASVGYKG